jgi:hypothetical protein
MLAVVVSIIIVFSFFFELQLCRLFHVYISRIQFLIVFEDYPLGKNKSESFHLLHRTAPHLCDTHTQFC